MKQKEPFFNVREPSIIWFIGLLTIIHIFQLFVVRQDWFYESLALFPYGFFDSSNESFVQLPSLLTHGFLHSDFSHLLMNAGTILIFGLITFRGVRAKTAKRQFGFTIFWSIFLLGIVCGGLFQWAEWHLSQTSYISAVGSSGGASTLFATAGWAIGGRDSLLKFTLVFIVLNVLMVFTLGNIAWAAHAGGFIFGALMAPYWVKPLNPNPSIRR